MNDSVVLFNLNFKEFNKLRFNKCIKIIKPHILI